VSEKTPVRPPDRPPPRAGLRAELVDALGDEVLVVRGYGELDLANRHQPRNTIDGRLQSRHGTGATAPPETPGLVMDLSQATYVGATIIAAMVEETERTSPASSGSAVPE
jgi:anti-anti-sigma regulatory factor